MIIRKYIVKLALTAILALSFASFLLESGAQSESSESPASGASNEPGAKSIHVPNVVAKSAPCVSWLPSDEKPRVAMLCIHGFSLHKGCYAAFGKEMAKVGVATYAIDLRGFGESKTTTQHTELDFDGCLADIKAVLEQIHKNHPSLPVVILGESMGGAIALRATAFYPELISGLITSVPARDRFGMSGGEVKATVKAGLSTIFGGYAKPMSGVANTAVQKISQKEEVRNEWKNDPLMRNDFSPKEFLQFDKFMAGNLTAAGLVKNTPVLFVQGTNDKLIRPAGTWKLFERLLTPNRQLVLSQNAEHLIFEEGQFKPDDLSFITTWIDRNVSPLGPKIANSLATLPVVASKDEYLGSETAKIKSDSVDETETAIAAAAEAEAKNEIAALPQQVPKREFKNRIATTTRPQINFWIELFRNGKIYRCNNKTEFKSGDQIRFHLIPGSDGYAYLVMKAGTTGKSYVLFPTAQYGTRNYLTKGQDYTIPSNSWMKFDEHPGTEQLGLVFANKTVAVTPQSFQDTTQTAFVSEERSGAKDLCPTRMKLTWDDPTPVMIPDDFSGVSQLQNPGDSSLVRLMSGADGMVSASIQLLHGN